MPNAHLLPVQVRALKQLARVVVPEQLLKDQGAYILDAEDTKHVTKVLRCRTGDSLELVDGSGRLQQVSLAAVQRSPRQPPTASVRSPGLKPVNSHNSCCLYQPWSTEHCASICVMGAECAGCKRFAC